MNKYVRGQQIRLAISVRKVDGTVPTADPATVVIRVTDPDSPPVTTDYTLGAAQVQIDTSVNAHGDYYYDLATAGLADAKLGAWVYAGITTGTPATAEKNVFMLESEKTRP